MKKLGKLVFEVYATVGEVMPIFWQILGLAIALVGLLMWILSYVQLGRSFGVLPRAQKRVKRGMYAYYKHPMYLSIMAAYVGLSVASGSGVGILYTVLVIWPLLVYRAREEDKKLED